MSKSIPADSKRGAILLLVLGVLSLLALLATMTASMQTMSKLETSRYLELMEARWLAQMGFERAVAELNNNPLKKEMKYWGSDLNENSEVDLGEVQDIDMDGDLIDVEQDIWNVGLEYASNPSLAYKENNAIKFVKVAPPFIKDSQLKSEGTFGKVLKIGVSGMSSKGTYAKDSNCYSLKITDMQSKIYVNDGLELYGGNQSSVSQNLKRLLNELTAHPTLLGVLAPQDIGNIIVDNRPPKGFNTIYDVKRVLEREYGTDKGSYYFQRLETFITPHAWVDKNVVNPVPLSDETYDQYPIYYYRRGNKSDLGKGPASEVVNNTKPYLSLKDMPMGFKGGVMTFRRGRGVNAAGEYRFGKTMRIGTIKETLRWFDPKHLTSPILGDIHNAVYALDELFPQYVEIAHRAPINVNTASEQVLTALLTDISGFFVMERRRFTPYSTSNTADILYQPLYPDQQSFQQEKQFQIKPQYQGWEYSSHTYDAGGYEIGFSLGTPQGSTPLTTIKTVADGDEYGYLYKTVPLKPLWKAGTISASQSNAEQVIDAAEIARHIVAARARISYGGINYSTQPFAGEFKRWSQFYRFVDFLVETGILKDKRKIFWNYLYSDWNSNDPNTPGTDWINNGALIHPETRDDAAQQEFASYAIADAIKANFNPNTHLNETNPDENLWLRVDKTDLIVNSTEFCFTPMGYFEVQSVGRLFKPVNELPEDRDIFDADVTREVAKAKVFGVVKAFDAYRETSQRHFIQGEFSLKQQIEPTNSGAALEIGPEPYNSTAVQGSKQGRYTLEDNWQGYKTKTETDKDGYKGYEKKAEKVDTGWGTEYDGWIQLSTLGGLDEAQGRISGKDKGKVLETPKGQPHWPYDDIRQFEGIHSHFSWDMKAHYHGSEPRVGDWCREEASSKTLKSSSNIDTLDPALTDPAYREKIFEDTNFIYFDPFYYFRTLDVNLAAGGKIERTRNFGDDLKEGPGPYDARSHNRIARSFRLTNEDAHKLPVFLTTFAPTDLRIDGAYVERNSGISYWIDEGISMFSNGGVISMWIKPSFFPEHTGKVRKLFSYDRWHRGYPLTKTVQRPTMYFYRNPDMFSLFFMPAHDKPPYNDPSTKSRDFPFKDKAEGRTRFNRTPSEIVDPESGVLNIRPSSFLGGMYQHWATGSLDDWESLVASNPDFRLWIGVEPVYMIDRKTGKKINLPDDPETNDSDEQGQFNGYDHKKSRKRHTIDYESYFDTRTLNHNLHPHGLKSASKPQDQEEILPNHFEAHKWTHVAFSWIIRYNRSVQLEDMQIQIIPGGPPITIKRYVRDTAVNSPVMMNVLVNGKKFNRDEFTMYSDKEVYELPGFASPTKKHNLGGRSPVLSVHSFRDSGDQLPGEEEATGLWRANTIRIGESSHHGFSYNINPLYPSEWTIGDFQKYLWPRNFSGDFTVDEFYLHGMARREDFQRMMAVNSIASKIAAECAKGRYYLPRELGQGKSDAVFTSSKIFFYPDYTKKKLPSADKLTQPPTTTNPAASKQQPARKIKLIGFQWTWFAEDYNTATMDPIMYDHDPEEWPVSSNKKTGAKPLKQTLYKSQDPTVNVSLIVFDKTGKHLVTIEGSDSGLSTISHKKNNYYEFEESCHIKYRVNFFIVEASTKTALIATPVFDDVTIFYSEGIRILSFAHSDP